MRRLLLLALLVPLVASPVEAAEGRRVPDAIIGFTYVNGTASLNTPGQPFKIRTGDTVVWTNLDAMSHDVTFDAIDFSGYLKSPGDTAEHTFTQAGHFTYHCNQHPEFPGMYGLVYVSDSA